MQPARNPDSFGVPSSPAGPQLVETPRRPGRWKGWVTFGVCALVGLAWWQWMNRLEEKPKLFVPARTMKARVGPVERSVRVTGNTSASRFTFLIAPRLRGSRTSRSSGELSLTLVQLLPRGSRVKKGDIVAEFDRQFMLTRVDDMRSNVVQQEATLKRLRAALELRRAQQQQRVRRAKGAMDKAAMDLKTIPVRSVIAAERLRMNHEQAVSQYQQYLKETPFVDASERASIRRYEIEVIQAESELRKAQKNADEMVFRAPTDGVLVLRRNSRGSEYTEIQEGDAIGSGQTFAEIMDTSRIVVEALVNQVDGEQVRSGQRATVYLDAFPNVQIPARVVSIGAVTASVGQRAQYVRAIPVRLELERDDPRVIPNLTASADIVVEEEEEAVVLPLEYVFHDEQKRPYAVVQTGSGWERRTLELGLANHVEVAVQGGVKEGDVVSGSDYVASSDK